MNVRNVSSCLQQCKNYKNRACFSRVMMSNVLPRFFRFTVYVVTVKYIRSVEIADYSLLGYFCHAMATQLQNVKPVIRLLYMRDCNEYFLLQLLLQTCFKVVSSLEKIVSKIADGNVTKGKAVEKHESLAAIC